MEGKNNTAIPKKLLDDGFIVLRNKVSESHLEKARKLTQAMVARQTPEEIEANKSLGSLISCWKEPGLTELILGAETLDALREMGFETPRFSNGYVFHKKAGAAQAFWHQDWWLWSDPLSHTPFIHQIGLMYYLQGTRKENGCLKVIPGSHRRRHPLHSIVEKSDTKALRRMENPDATEFQSGEGEVAVEVNAGDLLIMDARLLHSTYPNKSNSERTLINFWCFPAYEKLPEKTKAAIGTTEIPKEWPGDISKKLKPLLPHYEGEAAPFPVQLHPKFLSL